MSDTIIVRFKRVLKDRNITMEDAAIALGITRPHLSSVVHCKIKAGPVLASDIETWTKKLILQTEIIDQSKTRLNNKNKH